MDKNNTYSSYYVYGIIDKSFQTLAAEGIGNRRDEIYTIAHKDIFAVVSFTPFEEYDPTEENTLAHENVIQALLRLDINVAPMRFCTIMKSRPDVIELLRSGYLVLKKNLIKVRKKREFDVKMFLHLQHFASNNDIISHSQQIASELYTRLEKVTAEAVLSDQVTKEMILNASFLVKEENKEEFFSTISAFDKDYTTKVKIRISGPTAPYNFVSMPTVKNQY